MTTPDALAKADRRFKAETADWTGHVPKHTPGMVAARKAGQLKRIKDNLAPLKDALAPLTVAKADTGELRRRFDAARHPAPPARSAVESTAVRSAGYQKQTRRLAIQMRSREEPYTYRVSPRTAREFADSDSKGRYYTSHIRGQKKRPTRYTAGDRARLFLNPPSDEQVTKSQEGSMHSAFGVDHGYDDVAKGLGSLAGIGDKVTQMGVGLMHGLGGKPAAELGAHAHPSAVKGANIGAKANSILGNDTAQKVASGITGGGLAAGAMKVGQKLMQGAQKGGEAAKAAAPSGKLARVGQFAANNPGKTAAAVGTAGYVAGRKSNS